MSYLDGAQDEVYYQTIRRNAIVFATVFNNMNLIRFDANNVAVTKQKVPLVYGPKQHWYQKIIEKASMTSDQGRTVELQTTTPRMSFYMPTLSYDSTRQMNPLNQVRQRNGSANELSQLAPAPYNLDFKLSIYSKNTDDGLNVLEQILPMFTPTLNVRVREVDKMEEFRTVKITLKHVECDDNYASGYEKNRLITWDLDFVQEAVIYPPIQNTPLILQTIVDFKNDYLNPPQELEKITVTALGQNPPDYNKENASIDIEDFGESTLEMSGHIPGGNAGTAASGSYTGLFGYPPYTFALASGTFPSTGGLSSTGVALGNWKAAASFSWVVQVTDSRDETFLLNDSCTTTTLYPTLTLTGTYPSGDVGVPYSQNLAISGGNGVYSLTGGTGLASGTLPAGLSLSIVGTNLVLSGTPTTIHADYTFTVSVDSSDVQTATSAQDLSITPDPAEALDPGHTSTFIDLTNSNRTSRSHADIFSGDPNWQSARSVTPHSSGKYWVELTIDASNTGFNDAFGVIDSAYNISNNALSIVVGTVGYSFGSLLGNSNNVHGGMVLNLTPSEPGLSSGQTFMLCVDFDAGNGWLQGTNTGGFLGGGNPAIGSLPLFSFTPNTQLFFAVSVAANAGSSGPNGLNTINSGQASPVNTAPAGFDPWG
jgi:hypothetical protein